MAERGKPGGGEPSASLDSAEAEGKKPTVVGSPKAPQRRLAPWNYLLILGTVLSPMTLLRSEAKIGPSEVLVALWCVIALAKSTGLRIPQWHLGFWLVWLALLTGGTIAGVVTGWPGTAPSQLVTWFYLAFVAFTVFSSLSAQPSWVADAILARIAVLATLWYFLLYLYSEFVSASFLGLGLVYGGVRFTGGAENPHQVALLLGTSTFILIRCAYRTQSPARRLLFAALALAGLVTGLATESDTLVVALVGTATVGALFALSRSGLVPHGRDLGLVLVAIAFIGSVILFRNQIFAAAMSFIANDSNGLGRLGLWSSLGEAFSASPIIGLGPGMHAMGGRIEFHNTYLSVLGMSGILGLLVFLAFIGYALNRVLYSPSLMLVVLPLFLYGISGFAARRLPYWIILMVVLALVESARRASTTSQDAATVKRIPETPKPFAVASRSR